MEEWFFSLNKTFTERTKLLNTGRFLCSASGLLYRSWWCNPRARPRRAGRLRSPLKSKRTGSGTLPRHLHTLRLLHAMPLKKSPFPRPGEEAQFLSFRTMCWTCFSIDSES